MDRRRFAGISVALSLGIAGCLHEDDESHDVDAADDTPRSETEDGSGGTPTGRTDGAGESGELDELNAETAEAVVRTFLSTEESRQGERLLHSESQYHVELASFDTAADFQVHSTAVTARNDAQVIETALGGPNSLYDPDAIATITADETAAIATEVSVQSADGDGKLTYSVLAAREGDSWRVVDIYDVVEGTANLDGTLADGHRSPERVVRAYFSSETNSEARSFLHDVSLLVLDHGAESVTDIDIVSTAVGRENLDEDAVAATLSTDTRGYSDAAIDAIAAGQNAEVAVGFAVQAEQRSMTVEATVLTATDAGDWAVVDVVDQQETPMMTTTDPR